MSYSQRACVLGSFMDFCECGKTGSFNLFVLLRAFVAISGQPGGREIASPALVKKTVFPDLSSLLGGVGV